MSVSSALLRAKWLQGVSKEQRSRYTANIHFIINFVAVRQEIPLKLIKLLVFQFLNSTVERVAYLLCKLEYNEIA